LNETIRLKSVKFNWSKRNDFKIFVPELKIYDGEKILLLGESGSGKTTLLSLICGFLSPLSGDIFLNQNNIIGLSASKRDQYRSDHIGIIFQQFNLLPYANVIDNITLPLYFSKDRAIKAQNQKQAAINLCKSLRLPDNVKDKKEHNYIKKIITDRLDRLFDLVFSMLPQDNKFYSYLFTGGGSKIKNFKSYFRNRYGHDIQFLEPPSSSGIPKVLNDSSFMSIYCAYWLQTSKSLKKDDFLKKIDSFSNKIWYKRFVDLL